MPSWFKDIKESDRVALVLLYTGIIITFLSTVGYVELLFHAAGISEAIEDKALAGVKDFFAVGTSLIAAATLALKLQNKNGDKPPEPPKP